MNILAIDTSLKDVSVGLQKGSSQIIQRSFKHERNALRNLTPLISEVLNEGALKPADVNVVACVQGPGSFTGLRVGIAGAKAFADAVGAKMTGESTLRLLAMSCGAQAGDYIVPVVEACAGEVYVGLYQIGDDGTADIVEKDLVIKVDDAAQWLENLQVNGSTIKLTGPALTKYNNTFNTYTYIDPEGGISIENLIKLAQNDILNNRLSVPVDFMPVYLRVSHAESRA